MKKTFSYEFDKSIYRPEVVLKAVEDYSGAARFDVTVTNKSVRVAISGIPAGEENELPGEFCNYTLYLMKAM